MIPLVWDKRPRRENEHFSPISVDGKNMGKPDFTITLAIITGTQKIIIYLFTAIGLLPGGSGYFTCKQNMKLVTTKFKSVGLREKHVVATWNVGNHLSICL